ncbi:DNA cytosine methyltransferase [Sphingomonas sp. T9W2]|uniref:DNA cytosine methyltransferase n=1 Tax=Sphingomonas sp. T9W2 TaxID=3143183 RepID=UPI0031F4E255
MPPLIIDNFAGGGGASTGLEAAFGRSVDVAVNHDEAAVAVHAANHPHTKHLCQSIMSIDPLDATGGAPVLLTWFSPDCKHHSKAKGGKPRDKNIRDLAHIVPHWIDRLKRATPGGSGAPMVIMLENVEEFRQWGPLDAEGKPIKERQGEEFKLWVARIRRQGYKVEWRELVAADYDGEVLPAAPTSRKRLFLIARRDGRPIVWPTPTRGRAGSPDVEAGKLLPRRTAAECIDWSIECPSIFDRTRDLKPATCRRIAAGVMRYVVKSARPFIVPVTNTTWNPDRAWSADEPLRTITTAKGGEFAAVVPHVMTMRNAGKPHTAIDEPTHTITAGGAHQNLVAANMLRLRRHSVGDDARAPLGTITCSGHHGVVAGTLVSTDNTSTRATRAFDVQDPLRTITSSGGGFAQVAAFMAQHNTERVGVKAGRSLTLPASTSTGTGTQQQLVQTVLIDADALPADMFDRAVQTAAFLVKYYGNEEEGQAIDRPLGTVTTRNRFAVVTVTIDAATYVLVDIGMRMLTPRELATAQGFPASYILDPTCWYLTDNGNRRYGPLPKSHQIAKIGNSVCPNMSEVLARANLPEHCTGYVPATEAA